jgi:RNase H-fold protein (predicted Holliday junction resolvase)
MDLIFNPVIQSTDSFMTYSKLAHLLENEYKLKIVCIDDTIKANEYKQFVKQQGKEDEKMRNYTLLDQFAKKQFIITTICEIPTQVQADLKKDPLGVKSFLNKHF